MRFSAVLSKIVTAAAKAGLGSARLNLEYVSVPALTAGHIGRVMITEEALVSSAEGLATLQRLDPAYVDYTQSSGELLRLRQVPATGHRESDADVG